jgi:hypothetical protein
MSMRRRQVGVVDGMVLMEYCVVECKGKKWRMSEEAEITIGF